MNLCVVYFFNYMYFLIKIFSKREVYQWRSLKLLSFRNLIFFASSLTILLWNSYPFTRREFADNLCCYYWKFQGVPNLWYRSTVHSYWTNKNSTVILYKNLRKTARFFRYRKSICCWMLNWIGKKKLNFLPSVTNNILDEV